MKRDDTLTDARLMVQLNDRQKNRIWQFIRVKPLILGILVLGLASCAPPKPTPSPSVEVTPKPTPTPSVKATASPKPKSSAAVPQSKTEASQSAGDASDREQISGEDAEPEVDTPKTKAIIPEAKPQPTLTKPAPAIEPVIPPEPRAQDPLPPTQKSPTQPTQMAPIVPQPDSDPEPPPVR